MSQSYLNSSPERAARVAHYVNLDGATATALPGGVPTLAIWGEGNPARAVTGAQNVYLPDQAHTQTVTSAESFAAQYRFLTGRDAADDADRAAAARSGRARRAGGAVPEQRRRGGRDARRLRGEPAHRAAARPRPVATFTLGARRRVGAVPGEGLGVATSSRSPGPTAPPTHHLYFQPFRRTDRLVRLLTSEPNAGLDLLTEKSDRHTNAHRAAGTRSGGATRAPPATR